MVSNDLLVHVPMMFLGCFKGRELKGVFQGVFYVCFEGVLSFFSKVFRGRFKDESCVCILCVPTLCVRLEILCVPILSIFLYLCTSVRLSPPVELLFVCPNLLNFVRLSPPIEFLFVCPHL